MSPSLLLHCPSGTVSGSAFIPGSFVQAKPPSQEPSRRLVCTAPAVANETVLLHMAHVSDLAFGPKLIFGKQACCLKFPLNHFSCYTTIRSRKCCPHRWVVKTGPVSKPASAAEGEWDACSLCPGPQACRCWPSPAPCCRRASLPLSWRQTLTPAYTGCLRCIM